MRHFPRASSTPGIEERGFARQIGDHIYRFPPLRWNWTGLSVSPCMLEELKNLIARSHFIYSAEGEDNIG